MAFSCKLPFSRRQAWERHTGLSQFDIVDNKEKVEDVVDYKIGSQRSGSFNIPRWHHNHQQNESSAAGGIATTHSSSVTVISKAPLVQTAGGPVNGNNLRGNLQLRNEQPELEITPYRHNQAREIPDAGERVRRNETAGRGDHRLDDSVVVPPAKILFSKIDVLFICFSIFLYIADIGLDCFLAYKHYLTIDKDPLYFAFTVAFVLLAGVVTSMYSLWWYYFEYQMKKKETPADLPSRTGVILRVVACSLTLGPVVRYIDTIYYGLRSRRKGITSQQRQYYHDEMQYHRADGAMLRLFEAFLESAPQFLLQVFIVLREGLDGEKEGNYFLVGVTIASIMSSMISLAWSVVAYHKALRMSRHDVQNIEHFGLAFRFLWRLFEISPRIVILALFMSAFGFYLGIFAGIHFAVMVVWLYRQHTDFCEKPRCELVFVTVMGLVWCFCFFNLKDGHTRKISLIYYSLFYTENVGLALGWYYYTDTDGSTIFAYKNLILGLVLGSIVPMLFAMLVYYKWLHQGPIKTCLPKSYWFPCCVSSSLEVTSPRYGKHEGTGTELQQLTRPASRGDNSTNEALPTPAAAAGPTAVEQIALDDVDEVLDSLPAYNAPVPQRSESQAASDEELKPNLDGFVEVNGYLEANVLEKRSKLVRQDTMPKYTAPVPSCHYGATVPGGAPAMFTHSVQKAPDLSHGSTLPGAPTAATTVSGAIFVPYETENSPPSARASSSRPPLPQPRHSVHHDHQQKEHDESNLTTVSELPVDSSAVFEETLTPSPRRSPGGSVDAVSTDATSALSNGSYDLASNVSSLDTPLKDTERLARQLDLSLDTPVKDLLKERAAKKP